MPLDWTHDNCDLKGCTGDKDCENFPTPGDRKAMAEAAYNEYAEEDGTPFEDFLRDVILLALEDRYTADQIIALVKETADA